MKEIHDIRVSIIRIWQVLLHVRGVMPYEQSLQVAIAFTFLRRIDCLIGKYAKESASFYYKNGKKFSDERLAEKLCEISGGYPFYNYSGYTFNGILNANSSIEVVMNSYLQGFSKNVQEFLDGMDFNQNVAVMLRQSRNLVDLLERFSKIDLSASSVDNEKFVKLITDLLVHTSSELNPFYTPLELSTILCECLLSVDVRNSQNEMVTIYDPVCGAGSMLSVASGKAKDFAIHQANISLFGQDISTYPCAIAKALVLLSGNAESRIMYGNTLTDDLFPDKHFKYILAHPPFNLQWRSIKERIEKESLDVNGRFFIGLPSVTDSQFLFIEHILSKMDVKGCRAAFITTASVLYGGAASSGESRIRRWLFENDLVETIIALPEGTLNSTNLPVYLWILSNKKNEEQKGRVHLINASSVNAKNNRKRLSEDFVKSVVDEYKSKIVSTKSYIVKNEQLGFYEVGLLKDGKKKETVSISLDTDIKEFIEKERQPFEKGKITVDYSSVEKGYAVKFNKFFITEDNQITSLQDTKDDVLSIIDAVISLKPLIQRLDRHIEVFAPQKFEIIPLRAAIDVVSGINRPPVPNEDGLPILSVSYLRNPSSSDRYEVTPKSKCATSKDVIVIMKGANSGEIFRGVDGILSPSLAAIRCTDENKIDPHFLYYLLKANERELMAKSKGASIKSLNVRMIQEFLCFVPPIEEQRRISSYLDPIVDEIDIIMKRLKSSDNAFAVFRQALIENVVRGKFRI